MKHSNKPFFIVAGTSAFTAIILVVGILTGSLFVAPALDTPVKAATLLQQVNDNDLMAAYEDALVGVYHDAVPSVVSIRVTKSMISGLDNGENLPKDHPEFFNQGSGSGFVWDTQGHIVTNDHVVDGATDIEVFFANDTIVPATLVGTDPDSDLAVIKVDLPASELTPLPVGDSNNLQVGQLAIAIGSPFGQEFTMTSGIVSAVGRLIQGRNAGFSIPAAIQTDAPINPGNSGGPLLNRAGEVIGINAQMYSTTGGSSGIGFAIPVDIARQVVPTLISGGSVKYAWLGISGGEVTPGMLEFRGLDSDVRGAVVSEVMEGGPAEKAGLQGRDAALDETSDAYINGGDIITAINSTPLAGIDDLISYLVTQTKPGDKVTLDVIHTDGSQEQMQVTLGSRPEALQ